MKPTGGSCVLLRCCCTQRSWPAQDENCFRGRGTHSSKTKRSRHPHVNILPLLFDFHSYLWAIHSKQHDCMHRESPSVTVCCITLDPTCSGQLSAHLCVQLLYRMHPAASIKTCPSPFILHRSPHEHLGVIHISLLELLQGVARRRQ